MDVYEKGTVRNLLASDLVTPATRLALEARLDERTAAPRFFPAPLFATLCAACRRLLAQDEHDAVDIAAAIDIAGAIDRRLAEGKGDGWRYAEMPPDGEAYRLGLDGLNEAAILRYGLPFAELSPGQQDEMLAMVQRGEVSGPAWERVPSRRFFEELLAEAAEIFYSHPLAQEEIGYAGMADAHGWQAVGPDELAAHEPRPLPREGRKGGPS